MKLYVIFLIQKAQRPELHLMLCVNAKLGFFYVVVEFEYCIQHPYPSDESI